MPSIKHQMPRGRFMIGPRSALLWRIPASLVSCGAALALATGIGFGDVTYGQTSQPADSPAIASSTTNAASAPQPTELEDVVVTARRREESAQKVPVTISSISNAAIDDRQIENISEIQFLVPSLRI